MLALLIDWGYRPDGIPVRIFGAWTTLPAGPATLAAKTGSAILPVAIRRTADGLFHVSYAPVIAVASRAPADLQRATQAVADALAATIARGARAVVQLQADVAGDGRGSAELEERAAAMLADDRPRAERGRSQDGIDYVAVPAEAVVPAAPLLPGSAEA